MKRAHSLEGCLNNGRMKLSFTTEDTTSLYERNVWCSQWNNKPQSLTEKGVVIKSSDHESLQVKKEKL